MKDFITIFLLTLSLSSFSQDSIAGNYRNYFGSRLRLNSDRTFEFTWRFDLYVSWTKGTWTISSDTLYLHMIPVYDTIGSSQLILSTHEISQRWSQEEYASQPLSSGKQNAMPLPEKLYFKKGRLYEVKNGQLIKRSKKLLGQRKSFIPGFSKVTELKTTCNY